MNKFYCEKENELKNKFMDVLNNQEIRTVYQPIVSLRDGSVFGYEALSRGPMNSEMQSPDKLFEYAERYSKLWDLEFLCRSKALEKANHLQPNTKLFLNVNPNIMHDIKFKQGFTKEYLNKFSIDPKNIIFEITEKEAINNVSDFIKTVENYKDQQYKIAIDDAGAGYSGLNLISDIHPHFIKLDMNLIRDVDKDVIKQSLIKSMYEFAALTNTYLIAEGIETKNELLKLIEIGIHYGQGYFIQEPCSTMGVLEDGIPELINDANDQKNCFLNNKTTDTYISIICRPLESIEPNVLISDIYDKMINDSSLPGFCITEDHVVIGVITRGELFKYIGGRYGYTLFAAKPVRQIMNKEFLCVEHETTIQTTSKRAMQRETEKIYDFITITKEGKYLGIVTVKDLLEKAIEIEVIYAKYLNPLSELPGNILIEKQLDQCIHLKQKNIILYFDIDNFKAYNDVYGFENGDRAIKCLTKILKKHIPYGAFIGHIGGDDFVAIISKNSNAEDICANIIKDFDQDILQFYSSEDVDKKFILAKNRNGVEEHFPLLSISIAGVHSECYNTMNELSQDMGRQKKICKQKEGSNYIII